MYLLRSIAIFVVASLTISASTAQGSSSAVQAPATQSPTLSAPSALSAQATVLKTSTNLVLVDVVVTDRGKAVDGLDRQHFHVLEDGHEQTISFFDEHQPSTTSAQAVKPAALPPHVFTNRPVYPEASAVNVLLLDGLNTPTTDQMYARQQMLQLMGKIEPGTSLAVFTLSSQLRMVSGFTTDAAELTKSLQSKEAGAQHSVVLALEGDRAVDPQLSDMAATGATADAITAMHQFQADLTAYQTDLRVGMTLDALKQLARYLSGFPGRKNLIWFSGSFPIGLSPDSALQNPSSQLRNYSGKIREASDLLSAARVAVYPVDARGLMVPPSSNAYYVSSTSLLGLPNSAADDASFMRNISQEQASMKQIAEQTGGQEYINTNGLKEAVANAIENGASYYTIGYVPSARGFDGQFRKIKVQLDGKNYKLAYRNGYYADPPDTPSAHDPGTASLITAATLHGAPPLTQIVFQARLLEAGDPLVDTAKASEGPEGEMAASLKGPVHRVFVDVRMNANALTFVELPDGRRQTRVEFALVGYSAEGERVNWLDRGLAFNLRPEHFSDTVPNVIGTELALDMLAGREFLRIAVFDETAGRAGSLEVPLTVENR